MPLLSFTRLGFGIVDLYLATARLAFNPHLLGVVETARGSPRALMFSSRALLFCSNLSGSADLSENDQKADEKKKSKINSLGA